VLVRFQQTLSCCWVGEIQLKYIVSVCIPNQKWSVLGDVDLNHMRRMTRSDRPKLISSMNRGGSRRTAAKTNARNSKSTGNKPVARQTGRGVPTRRGRNKGGVRRGPSGRRGAIAMNDASTILQHAVPELTDILEKDEFVADILGSGGLGNVTIQKFPFNPGQAQLFPLGAPEANKWTTWKCISAEPYLLHEVSEFATDGSTGKIYLSFDYNAANLLPTTKQQIADMHSASCMPCQDIGLKLIPSLLNRADPKYIRPGLQPSNTDIRLYDGGNLYVASIGQAGTTKISELRIRYKFRLELPTLLNAGGGTVPPVNSSVAWFQSSAPEAAGATTVATNPVLATATANGIGAVNTAGSIVLPTGNYVINYDWWVTYGGLSSGASGQIFKNGATAVINNTIDQTFANAAGFTETSGSQTAYVSSNGTDAFTFPITSYYSSSTSTIAGSVVIRSV